MGRERVLNAIQDMEQLARDEGLDFIPVIFEFVNKEIMLEACTYGLPCRSRHWSHGKAYMQQKMFGEMGMSRVYEIVFNNDPAYAYMMDNNTDIANIMVAAHVFGHSHVFKNNYMFANSDRKMVYRAAERAARVDKYIEEFGFDRVEHLMDIAFSMDRHIDWNKGIYRDKYPPKHTVKLKKPRGEFDDLLKKESIGSSVIRKVVGGDLPPRPEKDLLWFLANYAPLEDWERDTLGIIREESYYFYPIMSTKILNEGFAVYIHTRLMKKYDKISSQEYVDFAKLNASVVNPGSPFKINPYYLGFKVFDDIESRWDKLYSEDKSNITGFQKVLEVAADENDASFLRNYLTQKLATKMGMFNYGYKMHRDHDEKKEDLTEEHGIIEIRDMELTRIIENIMMPTVNYGVPLITIDKTDGESLVLSHRDLFGPLEEKFAEKTMEYIFELWGGTIELNTYSHDGEKISYVFDESGFDYL